MAQPSDLAKPVPNQDMRAESTDAMEPAKFKLGAPADVTGNAATQPGLQVPEEDQQSLMQMAGLQTEVPEGTKLPDEDQKLIDEISSSEDFLAAHAQDEQGNAALDAERPIGPGREFAMRFMEGLARNPKESISLMQKALGKDFEVFSGKTGELRFKKRGSKNSFPLDISGFGGSLQEVLGDFADLSGMGVDVAADTAGVVAGAAVGGPLGVGAGLVGGAALATAAREAAVRAFEGESSTDLAKEFALNTGINVATLGLGKVLKGGAKRGLDMMKEVMQTKPIERVKQLAGVRQAFEQISKDIGVGTQTPTEAAGKIADGVEQIYERLNKQVAVTREISIAKAGKSAVPVEGYAAALEKELLDNGVPAEYIGRLNDKEVRSFVTDHLKKSEIYGSGETSMPVVNKMIDDLIQIRKGGGMPMTELWNKLQFWKNPAAYESKSAAISPEPLQAVSRKLRQHLADDRDSVLMELFKDDPGNLKFVKDAITEKAQKADAIKQLKGMILRSNDTMELFADSLTKGNSAKKNIVDFKATFGSQSEEFQALRAAWMDKVYNEAVDPKLGIVKAEALTGALKKAGDTVVNEMLSPAEKFRLNFIAKRAEQIHYLDFVGDKEAAQKFVKDSAVGTISRSPTQAVRALWQLTRGNAEAARFLANDGLLDIAANINSKQGKGFWVSVIQGFRRSLDATDVYRTKEGREIMRRINFDDKLKDPAVLEKLLGIKAPGQTLMQASGQKLPGKTGMLPGVPAFTASEMVQKPIEDAGATAK